VSALADRLAAVWERIEAAGGSRDTVRLVAVTKGFGADVVREALALGLEDLGESYAQEMVAKVAEVAEVAEVADVPHDGPVAPRWHFVGRLQSNKVRQVAPYVTLWHSVDRASIGREIARRAPGAAVLVQVNVTGEASKAGCTPDDLPWLLDELRGTSLDVRGLMTIAPAGEREVARRAFAKVREMAGFHGLEEVSMGMSDDLDVAVAEGATMVRVGAALFGPRPGPAGVRH
jgi:pyridoxal phosphate enzyme (YggS family)